MILGIGVDLCRIARMKDAITSEYFVKRIFAPEEIEYARSQKNPAVHFANSYVMGRKKLIAGNWKMNGSLAANAAGFRLVNHSRDCLE